MTEIDISSDINEEQINLMAEILDNTIGSELDNDRLTSIFHYNRNKCINYFRPNYHLEKNIENKKVKIDFRKKKELYEIIYQNKVEYSKILKKIIDKKIKIVEIMDIIKGIFEHYNINYNDIVIDILTRNDITIENIKTIMMSYSKNYYHDLLLWNYLMNNILMYEERCDTKYWIRVYSNCIEDFNFYDLYTSFLYCKDISNQICRILLINGKYELFCKINELYDIKLLDIKNILLKSLKNFKIHNSYETIQFLVSKIDKYDKDYIKILFETFYMSNYMFSKITLEEELTIKLLHKKFKNKNLSLSNNSYPISIPMFLIEFRKPSLNILKFLHTKRTAYMVNKHSIYHMIAKINLHLYTDNEILEILEYYTSILSIPFNYYDKNYMYPLAYLIENSSIKTSVLEFYLKYDSINNRHTPVPSYDDDHSTSYTYILLINPGMTSTMIYELIDKKIIDPREINEKGENIAMMYTQNMNNFDKDKNEDTLGIYTLMMPYIDIKQEDVEGNNIMSMICSIDNFELVKSLILLFGFDLLNSLNKYNVSPIFKLINNASNENYIDSGKILEWLVDLGVDLKFTINVESNIEYSTNNITKRCIFEYNINRNLAIKIAKYMIENDKDNFYNFVNMDNEDNILLMTNRGIFTYELYKMMEERIDYNKCGYMGYDILLATCEFGYYSVLKRIFDKCKMNRKTERGENCLAVACYHSNDKMKEKIIKFLLSKGIDRNNNDNYGRSFYNILYLNDVDCDIMDNLIKEGYIDIEKDDFIQFVITNNVEKYKEQYKIEKKEILYYEDIDDCAICRDEIKDGDTFYLCSTNKHGYHTNCLDEWIKESSKTNCLLCMKDIYVYKGNYKKVSDNHCGQ
jgi:hypothetical protein